MQSDWAFMKAKCAALPDLCNVTIGIWPGTASSPYNHSYYSTPGLLYIGAVPRKAAKCAYAFDGSSDMRPNRGCGCSINPQNCAPKNPNWPCPPGHACSDRDPLDPRVKINATSAVVTACECARMGVTEDDDPIWRAQATSTVETVECLWRGPQYFEGHGKDELRRALKQQHHFTKNATFPWNEVVLDGEALNAAIMAEPSDAIAAVFHPLTSGCEAHKCADTAFAIRDNYQAQFGVALPVVGLDVTNGDAPFRAIDAGVNTWV